MLVGACPEKWLCSGPNATQMIAPTYRSSPRLHQLRNTVLRQRRWSLDLYGRKWEFSHCTIDGYSMTTEPESRIFVYQILYNEETKRLLDGGFIPLDNSDNKRPDWFEFWVIRNFLKSHHLQEDCWYGFLSPRFKTKTGLNSAYVLNALQRLSPDHDVALFSSFADHLALFQNPFRQMDYFHPGLLKLSQDFLAMCRIDIELESLVTCLHNSVFSNYVIAKPAYWERWLDLADLFFDFVEQGSAAQTAEYGKLLPYGNAQVPAKVFIQERFPSIVLSRFAFKTFVPDQMKGFLQYQIPLRRIYVTCDFLKERYCATKDAVFLDMFRKITRDMAHLGSSPK